jgi:diguanylate cyclase (GGDEF)-like protein
LRNQGLIIILFACSGGIFVAIFMSHSLTKPLDKLIKATHRISQGNLKYRILVKNKDEFSLLAREFNNMSDRLEETLSKYETINAKLQHDIYHDSLTGLANRVCILQQLEAEIEHKKENNNYLFAVLFLDCDRFKIINDSLGHDAGDQVLITIAQRLKSCIRKEDIAARLGGDEFVILLKNIIDIEQVSKIAERILTYISKPLFLKNKQLVITTSIGVVISKNEYKNPDGLLRDADITMYHAKQQGKAQYAIFQPIMHKQALERLDIETSLRKGLQNKEFHLYYQPIVCLQTSEIIGFEALLRWHHPTQGWMSPGTFIPIAEETGLIIPLGEWVLQEACHQITVWQSHFNFLKPLKISVNISSHQIAQSDFVEQVKTILETTHLKSSQLNLEITETVLMNNIETACFKLQCLQRLGVKISIDDFGTGYSSLNYLQQLPIDVLKIDRSFVARLQSNSSDFQIIEAIIKLGNTLGMKTLAEGIETIEQSTLIKALGVDYGQGFLFSKPLNKNLVEQTLYSLSKAPSFTDTFDNYVDSIS